MYNLPTTVDPNIVFLINRSELEGRLEVQYYIPEISQLEKTVREKSTKKLRDFIIKMSSGATPSVQEDEKYYGDEVNGIPFLRVQNLNSNSRLDLSNVKYINKETHENYLKRSQVLEGDLLVKITGVGRMAIASVAPDDFVGNTNQHMVVIKTEKREISDYLANYLNLDIVERLASRRATGATRPALDYPALKSIPIIENIDFSVLDKAERLKQQKEAEAKAILESIDTYLLCELGINLPEQDNSLKKRIFTTRFSEVVGKRFDSYYYTDDFYQLEGQLSKSKYSFIPFSDVVQSISNGFDFRDYKDSGTPYIKVANVKPGEFDFTKIQYIDFNSSELMKKIQLKKGNLLLTWKGTFGNALALAEDYDYIISSEVFYIELKQDIVESGYLEIFLNSYIGQKQFDRIKIGAIMGSLSQEALKFMRILLPPLEKQTEIANHIQSIRSQAKALQHEAACVLEEAKREVEKMILGE